jgi:hypothetical protein
MRGILSGLARRSPFRDEGGADPAPFHCAGPTRLELATSCVTEPQEEFFPSNIAIFGRF